MYPAFNLRSIPDTIYERAVFLDTSAFIELQLANADAIECKEQIDSNAIPTFTTPLVVAETHRRLLYDYSKNHAFSFLTNILVSEISIIRQDKSDDIYAKKLIQQYWDLGLTFCDAVSYTIMSKLGIYKAFTYDCNHFRALSCITFPPFYL